MALKSAAIATVQTNTSPRRFQNIIERLDTVRSGSFCKGSQPIVRTFLAMQSTKFRKCGSTAHPIMMAICCTTQIPVRLACHDFLRPLGRGIPSAEATTENVRAAVLRAYSSAWSISGRMVGDHMCKPCCLR